MAEGSRQFICVPEGSNRGDPSGPVSPQDDTGGFGATLAIRLGAAGTEHLETAREKTTAALSTRQLHCWPSAGGPYRRT